jgi:DNA-binding MarR family transcriptional regulator
LPTYAATDSAKVIGKKLPEFTESFTGLFCRSVIEMRIMLSPNLPKSAIIILDHLKVDGPMSPKQIAVRSNMPARTVSFALRTLMKQKLCKKIPNLLDMRQPTYHLNDEMIRDMRAHIKKLQAELGIHLKGF